MSDDASASDPQAEYASLVRAVAARLELERSFGIESCKLPPLPTKEERDEGRGARDEKETRSRQVCRVPRPASPVPAALEARSTKLEASDLPEVHVTTASRADLFGAKSYDIQIPEGLSKQEQLDCLRKAMEKCALCPLHKSGRQIVFADGSPDAELMFVGEAPGHDEDVQGVPFVGRAGQLLTRIIEAMGMKREEVYIGNICKCRPPENRAPTPEEMEACRPFLMRQIDIVRPKFICLLGATAVRGLLQSKDSISKVRGQFLQWHGIRVMPTFHTAYLLRNPAEKRKVWEDMQKLRDAMR